MRARRACRQGLPVVVGLLAALALVACDSDADEPSTSAEQDAQGEASADAPSEGELHECAEALPVPSGYTVLEAVASEDPDRPVTCVVTLASDEEMAPAVEALLAALDDAEWGHALVEQAPGPGAMVQLDGPECGVALAFPPGTPGVTTPAGDTEAAPDHTTVMVSLHDCDLEIPEPPAP